MQTEKEKGLEFLDHRLKLKGSSKITVDNCSKPTKRFKYVNPWTCYPSRNINKVSKTQMISMEKDLMNVKIISLPGITPQH